MEFNALIGSGEGKKGRAWLLRMAGIAAAVLIVAAGAVWLAVYMHGKPSASVKAAIAQATSDFTKGKYQQVQTDLSGQADKTNNKAQKVQIYSQLGEAAGALGNLQQAIHYFTLKHQLDASSVREDAYIMATWYDRSGDKAHALEQYKIALSYYQSLPQTMDTNMVIPNIQSSIQTLEGK